MRRIGACMLGLCILLLSGCQKPAALVSQPAGESSRYAETSAYTVSFISTSYSTQESLWAGADNAGMADAGERRHIPVRRIDSIEALQEFLEEYGEWPDYSSYINFGATIKLSKTTEAFDYRYFKNHTLLVLYLTENSGSIRHQIDRVGIDGVTLFASVSAIVPENSDGSVCLTDDMAGWFILIELDKAFAEGCTAVDAWYTA